MNLLALGVTGTLFKNMYGQSGQLLTVPGIPRAGGVDAVMAVSYTHLRAHETVLDLVCRLLLEKKNNPARSTRDRMS